jgi:hypothetical protein
MMVIMTDVKTKIQYNYIMKGVFSVHSFLFFSLQFYNGARLIEF